MPRLTTRILSVSMAACLALGSLAAHAQPRQQDRGPQEMRHGGEHDNRGRNDRYNPPRDDRRDQRHDERRDDRRFDARHDGRGAGPDHRWQKGSRVPPQYRSNHYVVNDWRGHHLSAPPRGYQWIQNGGDYLLIGIATGVIATLVLGNSF